MRYGRGRGGYQSSLGFRGVIPLSDEQCFQADEKKFQAQSSSLANGGVCQQYGQGAIPVISSADLADANFGVRSCRCKSLEIYVVQLPLRPRQ